MRGQPINEMDNNNDRKQRGSGPAATVDGTQPHKTPGRINVSSPAHRDHNLQFSDESEGKKLVSGRPPLPLPMAPTDQQETARLPATFAVKFLGKREAHGLWGIKYTRKPVDEMVALAKALKPGTSLPYLHFKVDVDGVTVSEMPDNRVRDFESGFYPVDVISYGVQDLIYTRVFSMIVVRDTTISPSALTGGSATPFECYAYVCDSRQNARQLTIALATAFQEFSKTVKNQKMKHKRIAIDLRTPEEMAADMVDQETEA